MMYVIIPSLICVSNMYAAKRYIALHIFTKKIYISLKWWTILTLNNKWSFEQVISKREII